jgi:hypothetical protein
MRSLIPSLLRRAGILTKTAPAADAQPAVAPPANSSGPKVHFEVASPAEHAPSQGLIIVEYRARGEVVEQAMLQVLAPGEDRPTFEHLVDIGPDAEPSWFVAHGHLLPNGPATLRLRLVKDDVVLAEASIAVQVRNEGPTAAAVAASLVARGAPLFAKVCDSRVYDDPDRALVAWFDAGPEAVDTYLADLRARGAASDAEIIALRQFVEEGYLRLPSRIDADLLDRLNAALDDAVAKKIEGYEWGASQRLHNLHLLYPAIRDLWLHPDILRMLKLIFSERAKACQSLTYVFGSEQQFHQDGIHLTAFPAGRMCGVWTALEDVRPESGELLIYPGSHRLERIYLADAGIPKVEDDWAAFGETVARRWEDMIEGNDLPRVPYRPKAGEVLIWHDNLMHGGMVRSDRSKTRRSIVGHYFANGCIAYHDSSGLAGRLFEGDTDALP